MLLTAGTPFIVLPSLVFAVLYDNLKFSQWNNRTFFPSSSLLLPSKTVVMVSLHSFATETRRRGLLSCSCSETKISWCLWTSCLILSVLRSRHREWGTAQPFGRDCGGPAPEWGAVCSVARARQSQPIGQALLSFGRRRSNLGKENTVI